MEEGGGEVKFRHLAITAVHVGFGIKIKKKRRRSTGGDEKGRANNLEDRAKRKGQCWQWAMADGKL